MAINEFESKRGGEGIWPSQPLTPLSQFRDYTFSFQPDPLVRALWWIISTWSEIWIKPGSILNQCWINPESMLNQTRINPESNQNQKWNPLNQMWGRPESKRWIPESILDVLSESFSQWEVEYESIWFLPESKSCNPESKSCLARINSGILSESFSPERHGWIKTDSILNQNRHIPESKWRFVGLGLNQNPRRPESKVHWSESKSIFLVT